MESLNEIRQRYEHELLTRITPFWEAHGIDREYGGYLSALDRDGTVYDFGKQLWMQFRMVYMFAALCNRLSHDEKHRAAACQGWDFLMRYARKPDGGYFYRLDRAGRPAAVAGDNGAEIFTASFAALAGAELYRATGDARCRAEAEQALRCYRADVVRRETFDGRLPGAPCGRALALRMIELNVLNTMAAANFAGAAAAADALAGSLRAFAEPGSGVWCENLAADGAFDFTAQQGRLVNPGHALEGIWFAMATERARKEREFREFLLQSCRIMLDYGWDREGGGIYYYRDFKGLPLLKNECMLKSWWSQCEALSAALHAYELSGDAGFLNWFRRIDAYVWREFRDPVYPDWFAYASLNGKREHWYKGSGWKAFFHVPRGLLECIGLLKNLESQDEKNTVVGTRDAHFGHH